MKLETLNIEKIEEFKEYCRKHKAEVDDSFLYEEDLEEFKLDEDNPTYIITDENDKIIAATSLVIDDYFRKGKKARFRIFHSEIDHADFYKMLMDVILKHTAGLEQLFMFVPIENEQLLKSIEGLKFEVSRYSFVLVRDQGIVPEIKFPEGYRVRAFRIDEDVEIFRDIRNEGFKNLKGSETPLTSEIVMKILGSDDYIEGGIMILYHGEKPVGIVRGSDDEHEGKPVMNIGPLAILPEYQGKGLGRNLLRASLNFANDKEYKGTILCVNAENQKAKEMYIQEGFKQVEALACYNYVLK